MQRDIQSGDAASIINPMKMKTIYSLIYIILGTSVSYGQQLENFKKSLDSLSGVKKSYQKKIMALDKQYDSIFALYKSKQIEHPDSSTFIALIHTKIYKDHDDLTGIAEINQGDKVKVLDKYPHSLYYFAGNIITPSPGPAMYKVSYLDVTGWVLNETIKPLSEYERELRLAHEKKITERKAYTAYKDGLIKKYGTTDAQRILEHKFWIGMTDKMARESMGTPNDINRSVGSWGVHEQWIYGNTYLYFENEVLTSYQN